MQKTTTEKQSTATARLLCRVWNMTKVTSGNGNYRTRQNEINESIQQYCLYTEQFSSRPSRRLPWPPPLLVIRNKILFGSGERAKLLPVSEVNFIFFFLRPQIRVCKVVRRSKAVQTWRVSVMRLCHGFLLLPIDRTEMLTTVCRKNGRVLFGTLGLFWAKLKFILGIDVGSNINGWLFSAVAEKQGSEGDGGIFYPECLLKRKLHFCF